MKAKQILMKFPDEFSNTVIRLVDFILRSTTFHYLERSVLEFWFGRPSHRVWCIRSWYHVSNNERQVLQ